MKILEFWDEKFSTCVVRQSSASLIACSIILLFVASESLGNKSKDCIKHDRRRDTLYDGFLSVSRASKNKQRKDRFPSSSCFTSWFEDTCWNARPSLSWNRANISSSSSISPHRKLVAKIDPRTRSMAPVCNTVCLTDRQDNQ